VQGLPIDIDLSFFLGSQLEQVCFGRWQISFRLEAIGVGSESDLVLHKPTKEIITIHANDRDAYSPFADDLSALLGEEVVAAHRLDDGGMNLEFSSGSRLYFLNGSDRYESFQIRVAGTLTIA
jgi:hypothetical protein